MNKLESASSEYDRAYAEYQSAADALARAEQTISADQEAIARAQKALDAALAQIDRGPVLPERDGQGAVSKCTCTTVYRAHRRRKQVTP